MPARAALATVLVAVLAPAIVVDLRRRVIPNGLTAVGALAAAGAGAALDPGGEPVRLLAGVGATAFLGVPALVRPDGMGMGDAKLAGVIGLCLGPAVAMALAAALLAGTALGVGIAVTRGIAAARRTAVPLAPFLALGVVVALRVS